MKAVVYCRVCRIYVYGIVRTYLKLAGIDESKGGLEAHLLHQTTPERVVPFIIKELVGHKSLNTTMRYVKIENKEQAEAVDKPEFRIF